jgi:hypothetical protein
MGIVKHQRHIDTVYQKATVVPSLERPNQNQGRRLREK